MAGLFPELDALKQDDELETPKPMGGDSLFPELEASQIKPEITKKEQPPESKGLFPELDSSFIPDMVRGALPAPFQAAADLLAKPKSDKPALNELQTKTMEMIQPGVNPVAGALMNTDIGKRAASAIASGGLGTAANMAAAIPAAEQFIRKKQGFASQYGQKAADVVGEISQKLMPEDPNFFDHTASGLASMAMFALPGTGVASGMSRVAQMGNVAAKLAPAIGSGISAILEAGTEAGGVYQDQIKKGLSPELAAKSAFDNFWKNAILVGVTNRFGIFGEKFKGLQKALVSAPVEGIQEAGQSILASLSKGEDINWNDVATSAGVGTIIGGGTGPLIDVSPTEKQIPRRTIIDENTIGPKTSELLSKKFPQLYEGIINKEIDLPQEQVSDLLFKSAVAGEEVLLKGGTPEEANQAATEAFIKEATPLVNQAQEQEAATPQKKELPPMEEILQSFEPEQPGTETKPQPIFGLKPDIAALQEGRLVESEASKNQPTPQVGITPEIRLAQAKEAAQEVLRANKIDDRVAMNIIDQIQVDEQAFKQEYGQDKNAADYDFLAETVTTKDRTQAFINFVKGSGPIEGRREGFYATMNLLLDENEKSILLKKYDGIIAKAADDFAARKFDRANDSVVDRIFQKILTFIEKFGNYLDTNKFTTADELMKKIEQGKFSERAGRIEGEGTTQYSAQPKEQNAPTFYSQLQNTLEKKLPGRAMPDQIKNILNSQEVKREEVEWSGINEWLADKKGSVTKEEVLNFLKENQVQIKEVTKGATVTPEMTKRINQLERFKEKGAILPEEEAELERLRAEGQTPTKFERYVLPGGENYRELLLTLPRSEKSLPTGWTVKENQNKKQWEVFKSDGSYVISGDTKQSAIDWAMKSTMEKTGEFLSSHFSEPNILAHVRFNDRTDADGKKVLFIEEIQSDWHQKGRDKGYQDPKAEKRLAEITKRLDEIAKGYGAKLDDIDALYAISKRDPEYKKLADEGYALNPRKEGVPNAPFKKTWHELSLKRMLRYAAENGYDSIAWTTGTQQAERYDLSKQINSVWYQEVEGADPREFRISVFDKGDNNVLDKTVEIGQLPDLVGKDVADRIAKGEGKDKDVMNPSGVPSDGKSLEGLDLKVGGEGMKGFYDSIIPSFLNKYTKKWGGRVGETSLNYDTSPSGLDPTQFEVPVGKAEQIKVHALDLTPDMKKSVLKSGQPLYSAKPNPLRDINVNLFPARQRQPKAYTERIALRTALQREARTSAAAEQATIERLTAIKSDVVQAMQDLLPETERGAFVKKLVESNTPKQIDRLLNEIRIRAQNVMSRGARTITEKEALKTFLKRESAIIKETIRETEQKYVQTKKAVIDEIERRLPPQERGRFLRMVNDASSGRDLISATLRIDEVAEKYQRKVLINSIKRETQRIAASKSIAIDYKFKVASVMNDILFQKPRASTLSRLTELKRYIQSQLEQGKDIGLPNYMLEKLIVLSGKPISEFKSTELEDILGQIQTIADLGKVKLSLKKNVDLHNKQKDLLALAQDTKPIKSRTAIRPLPGESLTMGQNIENAYSEALNKAQSIKEAIMPIDVFFDVLDGSQNYAGANTRIFKDRVDVRFSNYLDELSQIKKQLAEKAKGMTPANMERIGAHATRVQEGGMEKIYNNYGIPKKPVTPEEIKLKEDFDKKIANVQLTEQEMAFYKWMRGKLDEVRPRIAETMKNVFNADLGEVKNYFPFITDFTLLSDEDVQSSVLGQIIGLSKTVQKGFTIERTGPGKQKIILNAADVFNRHMDDVLYLTNVGETIKYLGELANSQEYQSLAGDEGAKEVREWIDTLAKKGGGVGGQQIRLLDKLRVNVGMATLGLKLSSALVQITPIGEGATLIGPYAFKGAMDYGTSEQWREFVDKNMPEIRERSGDDPAYKEFISNHGVKAKVGEAGYWLLKKLDVYSASSVGVGAYQKYMRDHNLEIDLENPNKEAIQYAQRVVRRTQSSGFFKDLPPAISRGKLTGSRSLDRALLQFQNFVLNNFSLLTHEGIRAGVAKGNLDQAASVFMWSTLMAIAGTGMRLGLKEFWDFMFSREEKKKDPLAQKLLEGTVREMLGRVPFMSQAMSLVGYKSFPVPSLDWMLKAGEGIKTAATGKKPETRARGAARAAFALARPLGIPGTLQLEEFFRVATSKKKKDRR